MWSEMTNEFSIALHDRRKGSWGLSTFLNTNYEWHIPRTLIEVNPTRLTPRILRSPYLSPRRLVNLWDSDVQSINQAAIALDRLDILYPRCSQHSRRRRYRVEQGRNAFRSALPCLRMCHDLGSGSTAFQTLAASRRELWTHLPSSVCGLQVWTARWLSDQAPWSTSAT